MSAEQAGRSAEGAERAAAIALVGPGQCDAEVALAAAEVGRHVALAGAVLVCGGLGGAMAAACRGAREEGGTTLGLLPGETRRDANPWVSVAVPTGLGELRNALVVRAADAVVAVGGGYGTLSEIALALKLGRPVVGLGTWSLGRPGGGPDPGVREQSTPERAVALALELAAGRATGHAHHGDGGPPAGPAAS